jgi:tRNA (adenine57-N1/adenine58-N1)-methyltransferase catalytic subunit
MLQNRPRIAVGDLVIVYEDYQNMSAVYVKPPAVYNGWYGKFPHAGMVGKMFGSRMYSPNGKNFVYLLPPTPELWTATLTHRTQILYIADISMIVLQLEVLPGCRVIEAGTGSGALSHALARSVGPTGHLFTYEFNEKRAIAATEEFAANGLTGHGVDPPS